MKKSIFILFILFGLLVSNIPVVNSVEDQWIMDGDKVYIDDDYVYLSAEPHTLSSSGWVEFTLLSKTFSGDIDVVWGFDVPDTTPHRPQIWTSYSHKMYRSVEVNTTTVITFYDIEDEQEITVEEFLDQPNRIGNRWNNKFYKFTGTWIIGLGMEFREVYYIGIMSMTGTHQELSVTVRCTETIQETYYETFPDWKSWGVDFIKIKRNHTGMNTWYVLKNKHIEANKEYKVRARIEIPFAGLNQIEGKYCWGIKRSQDSISAAYILDPWWNSNWLYRKLITQESDYVGSDLTNFPMLINITDTDLRDKAQDDGDDIVFIAWDDTTKLDHEIEHFDGATGELQAFIAYNFTSATDTKFWMYYGNAGASNQQNPTGVWDANFMAVYHMIDDPDASHIADSTTVNDGTKTEANGPNEVTGRIYNAQDFDYVNDLIDCDDSASLSVTNDLTLEGWVKMDDAHSGSSMMVMCKWDWTLGNWRSYYLFRATDNRFGFGISKDGTDGGGTWQYTTGTYISTSVWYYVVTVYHYVTDGTSTMDFYVDGELAATQVTTAQGPILDSDAHFGFGTADISNGGFDSIRWDGLIDESRVSNTVRSADWVNATYHNVVTAAFYSIGSEETNVYLTIIYYSGVTAVYANGTLMVNGTEKSYQINEVANVTTLTDMSVPNQFFKHVYNTSGVITETLYNPVMITMSVNITCWSHAIRHPTAEPTELPVTLFSFIMIIPMGILAMYIISKRR